MSKKLLLSIWRMIRQSKTRFLSIMMIVALGVAFFVGVSSSATVMSESVDVYDDEMHLKDITIYSNYGFDQEDADNLNELEYVKKVEGTWFTDVFGVCGSDTLITRVHGYTEEQAVNRFVLKEGRMPENIHEALAESGTELQQGFEIGSTVRFAMPDGEENEDLKIQEVTITGTIDTPVYLNMTKENSTLSNQYIRTYLYIPAEAFDMDYYTEMNILLEEAESMNSFSGSYEEWCEAAKDKLTEISAVLKEGRYNRIKDEAEEKYNDGLKEYEDGKETFDAGIADAEKEIADAQKELDDGKKELQEGIDKLEDSQRELDRKVSDTNEELDSAEKQVEDSAGELEKNKKEVKEKKQDLNDILRQIEDGISQIDDAIEQLQTAADGADRIHEGLQQIGYAEETLSSLQESLAILSDDTKISDLSDFPEFMQAASFLGLNKDASIAQLKKAVRKAEKEADKNRALLNEQKESLLQQLKEAGFAEDDLSVQIQQKLTLIENGLTQVQDGLDQTEAGLTEIEKKETELNALKDTAVQLQTGISSLEQAIKSYSIVSEAVSELDEDITVETLKELVSGIEQAEMSLALDSSTSMRDLSAALRDKISEYEAQRAQLQDSLAQIEQAVSAYTALNEAVAVLDQDMTVETAKALIPEIEQAALSLGLDSSASMHDLSAALTDRISEYETQRSQLQAGISSLEQAAASYGAVSEAVSVLDEDITVETLKELVSGIEQAEMSLGLDSSASMHELSDALTDKISEYEAQRAQLQDALTQIEQAVRDSGYDSADEAAAALQAKKQDVLKTKKTLQNTKKELDSQKASLEEALDGLTQIKSGEKQLDEYEDSLSQLSSALKIFGDEASLKDVSSFIPSVKAVYDTFSLNENNTLKDLNGKINDQLSELSAQKNKLLRQSEKISTSVKESGYDTPQQGVEDLRKKGRQLASKLTEAEEGGKKIAEAEEQIAEGEKKLSEAEKQIEDGRRELREAADEAQKQINEGWDTVQENREKIESAESELDDGRKELEEARTEGQKELDDALQELADARKEIDELDPNEWTVLDRQSHYASATYHSAIDQMAAISKLFPVFFILVAALVCLTTMTRMVSEQRGEIGVLRALGFSKIQCAAKYLIYAGTATVIGTVIGCIAGMLSFPIVIYHVWRMMYILPSIRLAVPWKLIILTAVMFLAAMLAVTWAACWSDLTEVPAQLLRPRAPKLGKGILIERIGMIWNRLTFTWKVTIRNIFRYRSRFIMTVAGVAGCTALLVTGFGIRDSINSMVDIQFYDIYQFDGTAVLEKDTDSSTVQQIIEKIRAIPGVESLNSSYGYTAKAYGSGSLSETVNAFIYEKPEDIEDSFDLRTRKGHHDLHLTDDGVIINEKLAENLGIKAGDTFRMEDEDGNLHDVRVAAVTELYIHHYAFMTENYYRSLFGSDPSVVNLQIKLENGNDKAVQEAIADTDGVDGIDFFDGILTNFRTMVKSLDLIVWTLIIASMSLAVVVLTNLINVNISEREREIATLKVLGFRKNEVRSYIFRENNILTMIGVLAGLPVGTVLHHYIMRMIEMDYIMFGREVLPFSYVISFVLTICFGIAVNHLMAGRLDKVQMVESLKSVE